MQVKKELIQAEEEEEEGALNEGVWVWEPGLSGLNRSFTFRLSVLIWGHLASVLDMYQVTSNTTDCLIHATR